VVVPLKKIIAVSIAAICIALTLSLVIHDFVDVQLAGHDSELSPTDSTLPENQLESEAEPAEPEATEPESTLPELPEPEAVDVERSMVVVPDDYPTIQKAVDCASDGDIVFVKKGQYNETVTISKSLLLLGEDRNSTLIDANSVGPDLLIIHDNVNVTGFTIRNTPAPPPEGSLPFTSYPAQLSGIELCNVSHCFIYGNNLTDNSRGVCIENSSQICVTRNEFGENYKCIELESSTNNYITHNVIDGNCGDFTHGIIITSSTNNYVVNNTVTNAGAAIALHSASDNILRDNKLTNNVLNFGVTGDNISSFINDVDISNTLDGKLIYYWIGKSNETVPSDAGCIILVNCNGITVQDFELVSSKREIVLANTNSSIINSNKLTSTNRTKFELGELKELDILVFSSFNNNVEHNRANIYLNYSCNNSLAQNTGIIRLYGSDFNDISKNSITKISFVSGDWSGITLRNCSGNQIRENIISGNSAGVWLTEASHNNSIVENNIRDNAQGGVRIIGGYQDWPPSEDKKSAPSFNLIFGNIITGNGNEGIWDSAYCTRIIGNNLEKNRGWGIVLCNSVNCSIVGNLIEGFQFGGEGGVNTSNCVIVGNNITVNSLYNQYNVWFQSAHPGTLHHNSFFGAINIDGGVNHVWDNRSEGNYWSNYNGTDNDEDGIGDTPYIINENNQDNNPLMEPVNLEVYQNPPYLIVLCFIRSLSYVCN
jgi:parallel beta-helix repeat protein